MSTIHFTVSVPTQDGFLGRECNGRDCKRYFQVHMGSVKDRMFCPYCGSQFANSELLTPGQIGHIRRQGIEKAKEYALGEIDRMFSGLARKFRSGPVRIEHRPMCYRAKTIVPRYSERKVDSELICPECACQFQVFGIFGYCPSCRTENMLIYDANLAIIRSEIEKSHNPKRALRHAYGDLVSTFQVFCSRKAARFDRDKPSFQELFPARKFFRQVVRVDILEGIPDDGVLTLRRVFQKRHVYQHADGRATEHYVKKIPEDRDLLGQQVKLSVEEFESGARVLRQALDRLCRAFE